MLRALFPAAIFAEEAVYEIQFGHVRRPTHTNTTWDLAMDEVPGQKWVDLSQRDYGLALLNDSKYGHRIKDHTIELNLLRSTLYPGQRVVWDEDIKPGEAHQAYTDQAEHIFRYALYPHSGDFADGGVVQAAYELNIPICAVQAAVHPGRLPAVWSSMHVDKPNIIIETVKRSEDKDGTVVRLYEAWRSQTQTTFTCDHPILSAEECNLLEVPENQLDIQDGKVRLSFRPFEIKTLKIKLAA